MKAGTVIIVIGLLVLVVFPVLSWGFKQQADGLRAQSQEEHALATALSYYGDQMGSQGNANWATIYANDAAATDSTAQYIAIIGIIFGLALTILGFFLSGFRISKKVGKGATKSR